VGRNYKAELCARGIDTRELYRACDRAALRQFKREWDMLTTASKAEFMCWARLREDDRQEDRPPSPTLQ
jgi:hypothetical protein